MAQLAKRLKGRRVIERYVNNNFNKIIRYDVKTLKSLVLRQYLQQSASFNYLSNSAVKLLWCKSYKG